MHTREEKLEAFGRLLDVLDELRVKCPWDRKQTNESLRPNTIEEVYELCDALMKDDRKNICKELGDVLLHVVFYAKIGSETGVALKNAIALASGVLSGLGYGDNTRAALMTRGLAEMIRFGVAMGGKKETFNGLTGIGDLIVTCSSVHSRNFQAGYEIGKANDAQVYWKYNKKTVEGVRTAKVAHELAQKMGVDMPIINEIYSVLYENKDPKQSARDLMLRDLKAEE